MQHGRKRKKKPHSSGPNKKHKPAGDAKNWHSKKPNRDRQTGDDKAAECQKAAGCGKAAGSQKTAGDRKAAGGQKAAGDRKAAGGQKAAGEKIAVRETGKQADAGERAPIQEKKKEKLGNQDIPCDYISDISCCGSIFMETIQSFKEKYDLKKYYGIEQEGQLAITVNNQVVEPHGMIADGKAYIQYDVVRKYINSRFYWDPDENILLYTLPKDMVSVEVGSKELYGVEG